MGFWRWKLLKMEESAIFRHLYKREGEGGGREREARH
jgi:hypothetical protein